MYLRNRRAIRTSQNMDLSDAVHTFTEERCREQMQCSLSSVESESDLSLAFEREEESPVGSCDELPAFEIRAFSPHGRTPSPIDDLNLSDIETPKQQLLPRPLEVEPRQNNPEYVALHEINAQISPPSDADDSQATLSRSNSLETIFEGVFLNTPPREKATSGSLNSSSSRYTPKRSRANLMELVAIGNRLHTGKENQSPGLPNSQDPT